MKRILLFGVAMALFFNASAQDDPVLMEINGKKIKRSEFEYIYNKNNSNNVSEKKNLDEYVDLFVNFKLKVAEAEALGLDTTQAFKNEYKNYRAQLAKGYLTDKEADEDFIREIYNHMKENVEASHILINCKENASPSDTLAAYNKAMKVYNELKAGADFAETAKKYSDDPSVVRNGGYLGYFAALQMVTDFEMAAYALQPGEIGLPVRSRFGYHIIKVTNRRQDPGKVKVAHIFKYVPQNAGEAERQAAMKTMDSLYTAISEGADFAKLAEEYSDDKGSGRQGGELGWVGMNMTIPAFEEKIYSMKDGEISKPFETPIGIHIVKKSGTKLVGTYDEEKPGIVKTLARMGENDKGQKAMIARLKKEYNMSALDGNVIDMLMKTAPDAELGDSLYMVALGGRNDAMFTFAGKEYGVQDFMEFVGNYKRINKKVRESALYSLADVYMDKVVLDYEDSKLEEKYPDFALLANEYRDGILLFNISNQEVWEKASADEEGLAKYFKKNRRKYRWDKPHFKGVIVKCMSDSLEAPLKELFKKQPMDKWTTLAVDTYNNDSVKLVSVKKGLFAEGENPVVDYYVYDGEMYKQDDKYPYIFVYGKNLKKKPQDFRDVRGPVSADYQNYLEKQWVKYLRKKYADKVVINEEVLKTVNNH